MDDPLPPMPDDWMPEKFDVIAYVDTPLGERGAGFPLRDMHGRMLTPKRLRERFRALRFSLWMMKHLPVA